MLVLAASEDAAHIGQQHAAVSAAVAALDGVRDGNLDRRTPASK